MHGENEMHITFEGSALTRLSSFHSSPRHLKLGEGTPFFSWPELPFVASELKELPGDHFDGFQVYMYLKAFIFWKNKAAIMNGISHTASVKKCNILFWHPFVEGTKYTRRRRALFFFFFSI